LNLAALRATEATAFYDGERAAELVVQEVFDRGDVVSLASRQTVNDDVFISPITIFKVPVYSRDNRLFQCRRQRHGTTSCNGRKRLVTGDITRR